MGKKVRYLNQVVPHLEKKYGLDKSQAIMDRAFKRYDELVEENKDEPKEYHIHTWQRIYPAIAMFDAMTSEGIEREAAANFLNDYYRWRASEMAPKIKALFKIPGLYKFVPNFFFNMTKKSFGPQMGFAYEDKYLAKNEMRFNMVKCPYNDKCTQYGYPEIVKGYCDADDICYGNMHPRLTWGRTKTIGHGYDVCDFMIRIKEK